MSKKITIGAIAKEANVSPASVSMILNRKSITRFSDETVERVLAVAETLGYKKRPVKNYTLIRPLDTLIVVICPSLFNPFYTTIIQGIEIAARREGYSTSVRTTYWDMQTERLVMQQAQELNVAGVIFAMIPQQPELAHELSQHVPVVAIGDRHNDLDLATVEMNNYAAGQMLGEHLIKLGHKKAAYISSTLNNQHSSRVRRCQGLKEAFKSVSGGSVTIYTKDITSDFELNTTEVEYLTGYELAKTCLTKSPEVTAMVAINDMLAYGVFDAIKDSGRRIPEDISLAGFDNIFPSKLQGLDLTTVDHSLTGCGKSAFGLLKSEILHYQKHGTFHSETHVNRIEYKSVLVPRQTTGPCKNNQLL